MKKKETKTETAAADETLKTKRAARTRKKAEPKPAAEDSAAAVAEDKTEDKPEEKPAKKRATRKKKAPEEQAAEKQEQTKPTEEAKKPEAEKPAPKTKAKKQEAEKPAPKAEPEKPVAEKPAPKAEAEKPVAEKPAPKPAVIPPMQNVKVHDFCDLVGQGGKIPVLGDQQIQMLTWEDAQRRCEQLEHILLAVLDYDIVLSDTNIWLELLVGHSSSHSDPRVNARLQFERQLESLSRMMKRIGGRFMVMSETYEEIDRFASAQEPVNYKDADWSDDALCRNVAARLAKRLMLAQQKENRLRIEGIGSESHHESFADPAIIRRTVEFFATGKKVLLLTNDTSVGIRSLGMCDDLQRVNEIDDETWRTVYEPQRPMVLTMDDLKLLDTYTRQYFYLCTAAGRPWMQDAMHREPVTLEKPLELWLEGFRPSTRSERKERKEQERKEQQRREQEQKEQQRKEQQRREQEKREQRKEQQRREQEQKEQQRRKAEQEEGEKKAAEQEAAPIEAPMPAADSQPSPEPADDEPAAPEEKKSRSRRGGRGRRGKKNSSETAQ